MATYISAPVAAEKREIIRTIIIQILYFQNYIKNLKVYNKAYYFMNTTN